MLIALVLRRYKRRKMKTAEVPPSVRERMRKVFSECYHAVQGCEDPDTGRRRWELFKELPDHRVRFSPPLATNY